MTNTKQKFTEIKTEKMGPAGPVYECTNLNVCLGDSSEEMMYTGQLMVYRNGYSTDNITDTGNLVKLSKLRREQRGREWKMKYTTAQKQRNLTVEKTKDPWSKFSFLSQSATTVQGKMPTTNAAPAFSFKVSGSSSSCYPIPTFTGKGETQTTPVTVAPIISVVPATSYSTKSKPFSANFSTSATLGLAQSTLTFSSTFPISSTTAHPANVRNSKTESGVTKKQPVFTPHVVFGLNSPVDNVPSNSCELNKTSITDCIAGARADAVNQHLKFSESSKGPKMSSEGLPCENSKSCKDSSFESAPHMSKYEACEESGLAQASTSQRNSEFGGASKQPLSPTVENALGEHSGAKFKEKSTAVKKEKTAEDSDDEVEVSSDSGIDAAVTCLKKLMRNNEKSGCSSTTSLTSMELYHDLYQAKQHCHVIQSSLMKALVSELRKLEVNLKLEQNDQSSSESITAVHQSLVLLLEGLLKCLDIQLGLNHGLRVVLDDTSDIADHFDCYDSTDEDFSLTQEDLNHTDLEAIDDQLIESRCLMNRTSFVQAFVCVHLVNPYSSDLRYSCGADHIFSLLPFSYYLPHGKGRLESLSGNLIYDGQWKKGKRWGFGKAFIFSGHELSASRNQYGMYQGHWWNNMRHGHGRLVFASSAEYNGEWQYDLMSGVGTMKYPDGSSFKGIWDENEPDGCGMFTWPNGAVECREYGKGQVLRVIQLPENTSKTSSYSNTARDYSILRLKYQTLYEEKAALLQSNSKLKDTLDTMISDMVASQKQLKDLHEGKIKTLKSEFRKMLYSKKVKIEEQQETELKKLKESYESKIKELEGTVSQVRQELETKESAFLCQICFERQRDCIIMPCTHMLYCRDCISKVRNDGHRCPACRGNINGEIYCNINL